MKHDSEIEWFDRIISQTKWPEPPASLYHKIMAHAEMEGRGTKLSFIESSWQVVCEYSLLVGAMAFMFVLGVVTPAFSNSSSESTSPFHAPYYAGSGMYIVQQLAR